MNVSSADSGHGGSFDAGPAVRRMIAATISEECGCSIQPNRVVCPMKPSNAREADRSHRPIPKLRILAIICKRLENRACVEPTFLPIRRGGFGAFGAASF